MSRDSISPLLLCAGDFLLENDEHHKSGDIMEKEEMAAALMFWSAMEE